MGILTSHKGGAWSHSWMLHRDRNFRKLPGKMARHQAPMISRRVLCFTLVAWGNAKKPCHLPDSRAGCPIGKTCATVAGTASQLRALFESKANVSLKSGIWNAGNTLQQPIWPMSEWFQGKTSTSWGDHRVIEVGIFKAF